MNNDFKRIQNIARSKLGSPPTDAPGPIAGPVAGAVLGGLLLGPLGAVLGGVLGNNAVDSSSNSANDLGLTKAQVEGIEKLGNELKITEEAKTTAMNQRDNILRLKRQLTLRSEDEYADARARLEADDEDGARAALLNREQTKGLIKKCEDDLASASERIDKLDCLIVKLGRRLSDMEHLVLRARTAKIEEGERMREAVEGVGSMADDDLERRFRELEG